MKTYLCTKSVKAAKITDIVHKPLKEGQVFAERWNIHTDSGFDPLGYHNALVDADFIRKHKPQVGGYLVQYEDGYLSYSPAEAFEKGYLESPDCNLVYESGAKDVSHELYLPPGHTYTLANLDPATGFQLLQFICKTPKVGGAPGELETLRDGTTNAATIEALIQRLKTIDAKFPCVENDMTIAHLGAALGWQHTRTQRRKAAGIEGKALPMPTYPVVTSAEGI